MLYLKLIPRKRPDLNAFELTQIQPDLFELAAITINSAESLVGRFLTLPDALRALANALEQTGASDIYFPE